MAGKKRTFGWLATVTATGALVLGAGTAGAASPFVQAQGALSDLAPATADATDGASGQFYAIAGGGQTTFVLFVSGLNPASAGTTYGAHVHVGTCEAGNGAAAGPHYNTGGTPSTTTEVWLDFKVLPGGYGFAVTTTPFVIEPGTARAVVIHAQPTQAGGATPGAAGGRIACLPVAF
jgi:Cu/Zn superoxide dismutase